MKKARKMDTKEDQGGSVDGSKDGRAGFFSRGCVIC